MTRTIKIGDVTIGGGNPIAIQSMLNAHYSDIEENVQQAVALDAAGCEIIRVSVPNEVALKLIPAIKAKCHALLLLIYILITKWHWPL